MSNSNYTEERLSDIEAALQCPVCYSIPRNIPISSCSSGHIICQSCTSSARITSCPTCRQSMPAGSTNSVVASLIELVNHECKYRNQGCEDRMLLRDLELHESKCPERTITCPYYRCEQIVKFKYFRFHAIEHSLEVCNGPTCNGCTIHTYRMSECPDRFEGRPWLLTCSRSGAEQLYLHVGYSKDEDKNEMCYVFSVWTGRDVDCASKYKANIKIGNIGNEMTTVKGLLISSVENVPSSDEYGRYFFWFPEAKVEDTLIAIVSIEKCDKWKLRSIDAVNVL